MVLPKKWKLFFTSFSSLWCLKNQAAISEFGLKPVLSHQFHAQKKLVLFNFFNRKIFIRGKKFINVSISDTFFRRQRSMLLCVSLKMLPFWRQKKELNSMLKWMMIWRKNGKKNVCHLTEKNNGNNHLFIGLLTTHNNRFYFKHHLILIVVSFHTFRGLEKFLFELY